MKPLSLGPERNSIVRPIALSLSICVMAPVLHAGWGSMIKSAAENAAKKAVKQKVEETVEEAVTDAISQPGEKEGSSTEAAAMRSCAETRHFELGNRYRRCAQPEFWQ